MSEYKCYNDSMKILIHKQKLIYLQKYPKIARLIQFFPYCWVLPDSFPLSIVFLIQLEIMNL